MNHEMICRYCGTDKRLWGLNCCEKYIETEKNKKKIETENIMNLGNILNKKYGIIIYRGDCGSVIIPKDQIVKLIKFLKKYP